MYFKMLILKRLKSSISSTTFLYFGKVLVNIQIKKFYLFLKLDESYCCIF